ncbi:MAG: HNH endonuclease [Actinobacteria bacterium]|nr:HNH endonuclease [Actinomycetota bacterium]
MTDHASGDLAPDEPGGSPAPPPPIPGAGPDEPGMWLTASAWLPATLLAELESGASVDNDHALGVAFRQAGPLDEMPPGPVLTAFLSECSAPTAESGIGREEFSPASPPPSGTTQIGPPASMAARIANGSGLAQREDNALLGLIRGWRKVASLAAAAELAAVSEFSRRRQEQAKSDGASDGAAIDAADVELAAVLTLTTRGTQLLMDRAAMLHELPATGIALAAGRIDWPKALVLINGLSGQDPDLAGRIESQLIGRAPQQTTGQLRVALNRALLAADPAAAERQREAEERHARIERGPEPGGVTALLAGRCLPVTGTVTAWNRITAMARQLRLAGAGGSLDELRVHVYLALLNGDEVAAPAAADGPEMDPEDDTAADESAPASSQPGPVERPARGLRGTINLTVPLGTVMRISDGPGQLTGFGPVTGHTARQLADRALGQPGVHWCITVTGEHGEAVGHGCATRIRSVGGPAGSPGWLFTVKLTALAGSECAHDRASPHYRPPPSLWHLIQMRNTSCTAPGCRMPAAVCDDDHTTPFDQGGRTCECNLGPLCRHHHRVKQAHGWRLEQPEPGVFVWGTPSGRRYITGPAQYIA